MYVDLFRHLIYGTLLLSSYVAFLVAVPLLANMSSFRTQLLPWLSYHLGLSLVPLDPHLLSVALVTFFVYFFFYFIRDTIYSLQSLYATYTGKTLTYNSIHTTPTATIPSISTIPSLPRSSRVYDNPAVDPRSPSVMAPWNISMALSHAHHQVVQYYPAFVLSTVLTWANTNQFDIYSITFVIIQVMLLLLLPVTYSCPGNLICHLNRVAYQCALLWTLIYAICPREVGYVMNRLADDYLGNISHYHYIL